MKKVKKSKTDSTAILVRVPTALADNLMERARALEVSRSALIRQILAKGVRKRG